jgi:hypothetical protein
MRPDPRGPFVTIIESWATPKTHFYRLACGHVSEGVTHFHLDAPGTDRRCFKCGEIELEKWKNDQ